MKYQDKVVVVTGAGGGIGRAAAIAYARAGAFVVIADIKADILEETRAMIGERVLSIPTNVADHEQVTQLMNRAVEQFGRIDIGINNAGIGAAKQAKTHDTDTADWDRVIAVNQTGVYYCMREQLRHMMGQGSGCIVNVASVAGHRAMAHQIAYTASKHAVVGMTKAAALEYAKRGIRINSVCPVFTNSPMLESLFRVAPKAREGLVHTIPVGRYGENEDVLHAMFYLTDPAAGFVTGLNLPVDGGMMA